MFFQNKKIVFLSLSNLGLISVYCFIKKYSICDYQIFLSEQDGDSIKAISDTKKILQKIKLDLKKIIFINKRSNHNLICFLKNKLKIRKQITKSKDLSNTILITSINYGYVYYYLKNVINQKDDYLLDEGIVNWVNTEDRFIFLKSMILSMINLNFIKLPKSRIQTNPNLRYFIGYKDYLIKKNYNNYKFINIINEYKKLIEENKIKFKPPKNKKIILFIMAKNIHYKLGINYSLKKLIIYLNKKIGSNFLLLIKVHPGFVLNTKTIDSKIKRYCQIIKNNEFPIEFFDFSIIDKIICPINTSLFLLPSISDVKNKIFYYDIYQSEIKKKLTLSKKLNFKEIKFTNNY